MAIGHPVLDETTRPLASSPWADHVAMGRLVLRETTWPAAGWFLGKPHGRWSSGPSVRRENAEWAVAGRGTVERVLADREKAVGTLGRAGERQTGRGRPGDDRTGLGQLREGRTGDARTGLGQPGEGWRGIDRLGVARTGLDRLGGVVTFLPLLVLDGPTIPR